MESSSVFAFVQPMRACTVVDRVVIIIKGQNKNHLEDLKGRWMKNKSFRVFKA